MIFETSLLPFNGAITISENLIIVKTGYKTKDLIAHEEQHQRQMAKLGTFGFILFWFKYLVSKKFRKKVEIEAYKVSIENGLSIEAASMNLSSKMYGLDISRQEAINLLKAV